MGRGKVQLQKIEDKSSRQVTFSKRRSGLMKKARELSVLCDVDVATFVFSSRGRVYEYCSGNSLRKVLERYQIHPVAEAAACKSVNEAMGNSAECTGFRTDANLLQMVQTHLMELNNEQLNITELTQLENQLDSTLRQTRFKKTQLMMDAATETYVKENQLIQDNRQMEMEIAALMNNEDPQPPT